MVVTPALRRSVMCFGDDACYALGFGFPAVLVITSISEFPLVLSIELSFIFFSDIPQGTLYNEDKIVELYNADEALYNGT